MPNRKRHVLRWNEHAEAEGKVRRHSSGAPIGTGWRDPDTIAPWLVRAVAESNERDDMLARRLGLAQVQIKAARIRAERGEAA